MRAADARFDLAERERLRHEQLPSGLDRRLADLPDGHPSASGYTDAPAPDDERDNGGREPDRVRPLTDAEHAEHVAEVEAKLDQARAAGLADNRVHTTDEGKTVWSYERRLIHDEIIERAYETVSAVPCEHRAILAGGLAGAGKTTVIADHAGVDLSKYLMINPDAIKEEMACRGLIPQIEGLSPMEASDLVHEESSHIARRLAHRAHADGRNIIWDITMSKDASAQERIGDLRSADYTRIDGIFVDIPVEVSLQRAEARHRMGHDSYRAGEGLGGRYVPPELIKAQADPVWGSQNRRNFEMVKDHFDAWFRYDNSVDGRAPILAEAHEPDHAMTGGRSIEHERGN